MSSGYRIPAWKSSTHCNTSGERLRARLDIDVVHANRLETRDGRFTGNVIGEVIDGDRKAALLRSLVAQEGLTLAQSIAVGDGANDLAMIEAAVDFSDEEIRFITPAQCAADIAAASAGSAPSGARAQGREARRASHVGTSDRERTCDRGDWHAESTGRQCVGGGWH